MVSEKITCFKNPKTKKIIIILNEMFQNSKIKSYHPISENFALVINQGLRG